MCSRLMRIWPEKSTPRLYRTGLAATVSGTARPCTCCNPCQSRLYQGYTRSCIYTNNGYLRTSRLKSKTRGLGKSLCRPQSRGQVGLCLGTRQEPPGVAERVQSLILLCKVETRSGIDNLLNINVALMSTLHNDMLVIMGLMCSFS